MFHVCVSVLVVKILRRRIVGPKVVADVIFIDLPNYLLHGDCIMLQLLQKYRREHVFSAFSPTIYIIHIYIFYFFSMICENCISVKCHFICWNCKLIWASFQIFKSHLYFSSPGAVSCAHFSVGLLFLNLMICGGSFCIREAE